MKSKSCRLNVPYEMVATFGHPVGDNGKDEARFYCPECINRKGTPDNSGHLFGNVKTRRFFCVRCEYSGVLGRNLKISRDKVYDEDRNYEVSETIHELRTVYDDDVIFNLKIPIEKVTASTSATEYLLKRGFTLQQMEYYDMRVGNLNQEFGRIVIPNQVSRYVYTDMYSARTYIDQVPKYHNPFDSRKSNIVFNLHRIRERSPIILVEGALTAVAAGYHAVASLGKVLSKSQASQIVAKKPSVIYVNYDYGAEKNSANACKLLYQVNPNIPIKEVLMSDERDAADLSRSEYVKRLQEAQEYKPLMTDLLKLITEGAT